MKKIFPGILFITLLLCVSYIYNYHEIINKRPQSVHKWRQSDCASLALNYAQNGMHFFQPETHNLTSDGGTSGKACTSEIPLLYYTVALLYKLFGYNETLFRLLNTLLFFIGLFYLFRLLKYLLNDSFWAIAISLLFFTSPVLVFYGNNFISNSSALAFSIVGWYYFIRFYFEEKPRLFVLAVLVFFFAASFKVSALFSLFAIGGVFVLELLGIVKLKNTSKLFQNPLKQFLLMAAAVAIVFAWIVYAHNYNTKHDCTYFSTTIFPIWSLSKVEIKEVLENINRLWLPHYYHFSMFLFLAVCLGFVLRFVRSNQKVFNWLILLVILEIIIYVLLQFWTFSDHDYYVIDIYILPVLLITNAFFLLKTKAKMVFKSLISKILFTLFVLFNIYYAQDINLQRYQGWQNNNGVLRDAYTITPYLREIGINANDTVISIPDASHVSLYLMNQKGWTEYRDARLNRGEPILYNSDSIRIQHSINNGARYLIVEGIGQLYDKPYLQHFCTHLKGRFNNTLVFDLRAQEINFNLRNREIETHYYCNAELKTADGSGFMGEPKSTVFRNGETQSSNFARSGNFCFKVDENTPYAATLTLPNVKFGESYLFTAWRKVGSPGNLIVSAPDFYSNQTEIIETIDGWEQLKQEIFISREQENKDLVFYIYNAKAEPAYFDDFEIKKFKSVLQ